MSLNPAIPQPANVPAARLVIGLFLTSFSDFGLAEPILRSLTEEGYVTPTPIQAQTIPLLLAKRDVIGIAQTGTGKTAAFALPILNHLAAQPRPPAAARPAACWC